MTLTVCLVGEEAAGARALQLLADRGHRIVAAFTRSAPGGPTGPVEARAKLLGIPVRQAEAVRDPDTADWLREQGVELLLNVHSLYIIHSSVLDAPLLGAYNLHPGPLPERAGLNVPSWAVYEGADRHGVTLHRMTAEVDAGTIAYAETFPIAASDTGRTVMMECARRGLTLIERLLECAEAGDPIPAHTQDPRRRRWFGAGPPDGGRLDWHRPARQVVDFVRACDYRPFDSPWGFPRCDAAGIEIAIVKARAARRSTGADPGTVGRGRDGTVLVAASDAWVEVDKVQVADRTVAAAEVLRNGIRLRQ